MSLEDCKLLRMKVKKSLNEHHSYRTRRSMPSLLADASEFRRIGDRNFISVIRAVCRNQSSAEVAGVAGVAIRLTVWATKFIPYQLGLRLCFPIILGEKFD